MAPIGGPPPFEAVWVERGLLAVGAGLEFRLVVATGMDVLVTMRYARVRGVC
jgi:hypothetical protein